MNTYNNREHESNRNSCSSCGQAIKPKRIDSHFIIHEISSVLNFEKGILFTIKEVLINPKQSIRSFIDEDRNLLVKPIIFIIITSLIYTLIARLLDVESGYIEFDNREKSATTLISNWIQVNYGYANIIMGIFIAIWIKIFFRKHNYNFYEILTLLCFVMGIAMLIFSIFGILESLTKLKLMQIGGLIGIVYSSWAIGQFFGQQKINYIKALLSYLLGMTSFAFSVIFLGYLIDLM